GMIAIRGHDIAPGNSRETGGERKKFDIGHFTSEWLIVARDRKDLKHLNPPALYDQWCRESLKGRPAEPYWKQQQPIGSFVWTDDHSNLMAVFRWPWDH